MLGQSSSNFTRILSSLLLASLPIFAQYVPQQPYPQQDPGQAGGYPGAYQGQQGPNAGAADGGGGDQETPGAGAGVARVSLLNGDVSVRRGDSGDYVAATQNAPVMVKDSIQTGAGARAEVQFDITSMIRLAQSTEMHFVDLQPGHFQMQLGRGTVTYRILRDSNSQVEIDTPSVSIRPARMGIYRITVTDDGLTYVTPRLGQIEIFTPKGTQMVQMNQTLMARGDAADPEFQLTGALNRDDWDAWSDNRDHVFQQAWANTSQYVPQDVYGTEELQGQGQWVNTPEYGYAWSPNVGPDWSPYSVGRWSWEDYYGWTWISSDPWGWAPYHYGRWFHRAGFGWAWWPGRLHDRYFWSPALVGFVGFGRGGYGAGFGRIGWVPLAPHERFNAWYGRGAGRNIAVVNNTLISNSFRNARVGNGVVAVNAQQFGRGATGYSRVSGAELRTGSMVNGALPIRPSSQSMHFTDRQTSTVARTNFAQSHFASSPRTASSFTGTNGGSTWSRYSSAGSTGSGSVQGARQFGSTPGTRSIPQSTGGASNSGGWNRFNSTPSSRSYPSYGGSSSNGRSQVQISPPIVRQRGSYSGPAQQSAPRYSAPSYSQPRYSAPSYSQPHYSAPAAPQRSAPAPHYSAPSGGSGHSSAGSSGGHTSSSSSSSSSGGHHR